jgi:hypothetical protein
MADVRGLVGIDAGVLNQNLAAEKMLSQEGTETAEVFWEVSSVISVSSVVNT